MENEVSTESPMAENERNLADLVGAKMPADKGLTGLGLVMQVGGSVFLAVGALVALMPLLESSRGGGPRMEIFVIGVLSVIRSISHRGAGMALIYGSPKGYIHSIKTYAGLALAQSTAVALIFIHLDSPWKLTLFVFALLMTWPATILLMLSSKPFRMKEKDLPSTEDMGFESAAVLMTVFGLMGSLAGGCFLLSIFKSAGSVLSQVPGILWTGVVMMLLARSALHLRAGWQGASGISPEKASHSASTYFNFGVISSVIAGAVLMLQMIMQSPGIGLEFFIMVAMTGYLLLIWPSAVRMFFTDRNFSMLLDEEKTPRRSPDTGLTALGWLLLATGIVSLIYALGSLLFFRDSMTEMNQLAAQLTDNKTPSLWVNLAMSAVQTYAGFQLVRMGDHHRIATTVYGVVAVIASTYLYWPMISKLDLMAQLSPFTLVTGLGPVFFGLPLAIASIILVNRNSDPDAKARITA
jgi:hypothetical protein